MPRYLRYRLDRENYLANNAVWHVTMVTAMRQPYLADPEMAQLVIDTFAFSCNRADAELYLIVVMPDHVHAMTGGGNKGLEQLMRNIKSWTSRQFQIPGSSRRLWQPSYNDRGVRVHEQGEALASYILANPVRHGICENWTEYPWIAGSLIEQ